MADPAYDAPETAQEALAEAIHQAICPQLGRPCSGSHALPDAVRILAGLPPGWVLAREQDAGCPVPSSVTGQPCLLPAGHEQDSFRRFHRYAVPIEDERGLLIDGLVLLVADAKARKAANPDSTSDARIAEAESLIHKLTRDALGAQR